MAAGQGFKTFATGDILTAADTNGYLMQGIWVFANATARDAAVTSPQEGNACYLKDTDAVQTYSGSAWVAVGGGGLSSPLTTKGDVWGYSTTNARVAVGTNGQVLTADSTAATGVAWATAAGGYTPTLTLLNSGGTSLSGSTTTISSISGKQWLYAYVVGASTNTASSSAIVFQLNTDSGSNYAQAGIVDVAGGVQSYGVAGDTFFPIGLTGATSGTVSGYANVWNCNATTPKPFLAAGNGSGSGYRSYFDMGHYTGTSTISSISVTCTAGSFDAGTLYVYGA